MYVELPLGIWCYNERHVVNRCALIALEPATAEVLNRKQSEDPEAQNTDERNCRVCDW